MNSVFIKTNSWLKSNLLSFNFDKTYFLQFMTKDSNEIGMQISYENEQITNIHNTKFLGLVTESSLSWKNHIDVLIYKLSKECYAVRSVKLLMSSEVLRMIHFA